MPTILLAFGANIPGPWGGPVDTIEKSIRALARLDVRADSRSRLYSSSALAGGWQGAFHNCVIVATTRHSPCRLLRICKQLERRAGRRPVRRWGPRPLDIDILDYAVRGHSRILGGPHGPRLPGRLALPHPEIARRAFVLVPWLEVMPGWRHPRTGVTVAGMLRALPARERARVTPVERSRPAAGRSVPYGVPRVIGAPKRR
jgi:2-amino-4-hydroxy-6-hydroxymethyldihydropteridine diphosphokinase